MNITGNLLLATGLAMDCFAIAIGIGGSNKSQDKRFNFRLSFHFGLFQAGMTILGWLAGNSILLYLSTFDHWLAFGLLTFIGLRMIRAGMDRRSNIHQRIDASRGVTLVMLSVATSIDALAIGLTLAFIQPNITYASLMIGMVSLILTFAGLKIGNRLGIRFGKQMEILGGIILIGIGLNILYSHLTGI